MRSGCGKRDSPEIVGSLVLFNKLDSVGAGSGLKYADLRDDASRKLSSILVADHNRGTDRQLSIDLDRCSVSVQVGRVRRHCEWAFLMVMPRQSHRRFQRHANAAALSELRSCNVKN